MIQPQSKNDLLEQLARLQQSIAETMGNLSSEQFNQRSGENWSAGEYLAHLILSIKPLAKAMNFPLEQLENMFGKTDQPTHTYEEVVTMYKARLAEGVRAEDYDAVTPTFYRFPEGIEDKQAYLLETWQDANNRLLTSIQNYTEADLDTYQIPHPAVGLLNVREMLFFTVYHNSLHWQDMLEASGVQTTKAKEG